MSAVTVYPPRKRFTRDEVEQMLHAGIFVGQRLELIDGELIDKMGQDPPHSHTLRIVHAWLIKIFGERTQMQQPIEAGAADRQRSLPEPDFSILAEFKDDYRRRHPRGDELLLSIEVADTSLRFDSTVKRDLYARAGIPEYWVLDINARRLIVHKNPVEGKFQEVITLPENASVSIGGAQITVSQLLP
jgi:Uma2 family endonuclease